MSPETATHLTELFKILGPFIYVIGTLLGVIGALIVWAWKKMEKSIDKLETTITKYVTDDDVVHDQLFDLQRATDQRLNVLIGEHNVRHP